MFVLGNLIGALATVVDILLSIFYWLLLIRAVISWVNPDPYNAIVQFLYRATEPVLQPLRRFVPPIGGLDVSIIVAFLAVVFLRMFLVATLVDLSYQLR